MRTLASAAASSCHARQADPRLGALGDLLWQDLLWQFLVEFLTQLKEDVNKMFAADEIKTSTSKPCPLCRCGLRGKRTRSNDGATVLET